MFYIDVTVLFYMIYRQDREDCIFLFLVGLFFTFVGCLNGKEEYKRDLFSERHSSFTSSKREEGGFMEKLTIIE